MCGKFNLKYCGLNSVFLQSWTRGKNGERKKKPKQIEESEKYHIFPFWRPGNLGTCCSLGEGFDAEGVVNAGRQGEWRKQMLLPWSGVKRGGGEHCEEGPPLLHWIHAAVPLNSTSVLNLEFHVNDLCWFHWEQPYFQFCDVFSACLSWWARKCFTVVLLVFIFTFM